jgi:hypothetical protein
MHLRPGDFVQLRDGEGHLFGRITVEEGREPWLFGHFEAGPDYPLVASLFAEFEEAVNGGMLGIAEKVGDTLNGRGFRLWSTEGAESVPVQDVQIMNGHDLACIPVAR